jgi:short subunit dehydrogenase-like uncharacterized protein
MSYSILLYGATGFSGRLIAAEGKRLGLSEPPDPAPGDVHRMVLAGRDAEALKSLAAETWMPYRVFDLDDRDDVIRGLTDIDVVINAAGPFAFTADCLAKAAVRVGCHYVDINGELDVYRALEDVGRHVDERKVAMVCAAGHESAASNLLLDVALTELVDAALVPPGRELGAIRVALSCVVNLSKGSLTSMLRSLREQVTVVRLGLGGRLVLWHEPVGRLERTFNFHPATNGGTPPAPSDLRIASAVNLVDTLTNRLIVVRRKFLPHQMESYLELDRVWRLAYQVGAFVAPVAGLPWVRDIAAFQIDGVVPDPTPQALETETRTLVLEIDDPQQQRILEWCWQTPNPYLFTARVVMAIAQQLAEHRASVHGWLTPSEILQPKKAELTSTVGYLRDCTLRQRRPAG